MSRKRKYDRIRFTLEEEKRLINLIKENRSLYDSSHTKFKDLPTRRHIFAEIAEQIGRTADECSKKWRNLRDLHVKRLKAGVENLFVKGDERDLTFLNEIKERPITVYYRDVDDDNTDTSITDPGIDYDTFTCDTSDSDQETETDCNLESQNKNSHRTVETGDNNFGFFHDQLNPSKAPESELFFYWVYKSVESLPPEDQVNIRIQITKLILAARLRQMKAKNRY